MPVFTCRLRVAADVADELAVGFGCGIEAERDGDVRVLEVAVNGFGHADNSGIAFLLHKVLGHQGGVGVGLEYNNIAVATDISIGIGAEFNLALIDSSFNYGANAVLDVSNWLDVDIALGGNQENIVNALGIGFILNNPSETLGLTLETEIGLAADSVIRVNPDLWFKAGAATYTAGIDIKDLGNFDETILDLFISLSF